MHIIITGEVQSGKSTLAGDLVSFLKEENISLAGILAPGLWKDNQRDGFDLVDLKTGILTPLARRRKNPDNTAITPFEFFTEGMAAGKKALDVNTCRNAHVIMVDEVGKLELEGRGWAGFLDPLLSLEAAIHIWIVREYLVEEVIKKWSLMGVEIIYANHKMAFERLKAFI